VVHPLWDKKGYRGPKKLKPEYIATKTLQRGYSGNEKVTARELQSRHCNFEIVDVT